MDFLSSFFQNIKDKISSPFFGTLTFIIIIHHWEFWYTLFNFDPNCNRTEKIAILRAISNENFTVRNLFNDVVTALGVMLIGYFVIIGTRMLSVLIEHRIMPFLTGKAVSKLVVDKSVYEVVETERKEYFEKYEEQRRKVREYSADIDTQSVQIQEKNNSIIELNKTLIDYNLQIDKNREKEVNLTDNISRLDGELINLKTNYNQIKEKHSIEEKRNILYANTISEYSNIFFSDANRPYFTSLSKFPSSIVLKAHELHTKGKWSMFISVANFLNRGGSVMPDAINEMASLGFLSDKPNRTLTPVGSILSEFRSLFSDTMTVQDYVKHNIKKEK